MPNAFLIVPMLALEKELKFRMVVKVRCWTTRKGEKEEVLK